MELRLACLLSVIAILAVPSTAATTGEYALIEDRFIDIDVETLEVIHGCGPASRSEVAGTVVLDGASDRFTFSEGEAVAGDDTIPSMLAPDSGHTRAVCATVRTTLAVPADTDHLHVRFDADRRIDQPVTLEYHMPQELRIREAGSKDLLESVDVFPWDDGPHDRTRFADLGVGALPYIPLPFGVQNVSVDWYFEDLGMSTARNQQSAASGQSLSATVWNPVIEVSSQPRNTEPVQFEERREGMWSFRDTIVPLVYEPGADQTNLRVRAPLQAQFSHIETASGARWSNTGVLSPGSEYGPTLDFILLERNSGQGFTQITIPDRLMAADGGAAFYVVFTEAIEIPPSAGLMSFNAALAAIPLAFAAMALQRIGEFHRQAFGGYRRTARNLAVTLAMVLAYYVVVVVGAVFAGWFTMASILPPNRDALLFYIQIALAMAAFGWLWMTGRAMYAIVNPTNSAGKA